MPPRRSGNPAVRAQAAKNGQANAKAKQTSGFSLARYREEATGEPFPFEVDDGHIIEIPRPTGKKMMDLAEKYANTSPENAGNPREQLADLLGDAYDEVMPILEDEDFGVMLAFLKDIVEYFDLGEALASFG